MDESGFYKDHDGKLLFAPNFVYNKNYELLRENKDGYDYPVDGWHWFETRQAALDAFGITEEQEEEVPIEKNHRW